MLFQLQWRSLIHITACGAAAACQQLLWTSFFIFWQRRSTAPPQYRKPLLNHPLSRSAFLPLIMSRFTSKLLYNWKICLCVHQANFHKWSSTFHVHNYWRTCVVSLKQSKEMRLHHYLTCYELRVHTGGSRQEIISQRHTFWALKISLLPQFSESLCAGENIIKYMLLSSFVRLEIHITATETNWVQSVTEPMASSLSIH